MIKYGPLLDTLGKKKMSFDDLNEKINGGKMLKSKLNSGSYIPLEMIDKICNVLEVPVEGVIVHTDGEQPGDNKIKVNWNKVSELAKKERYSFTALSRICHLDSSYLSQAKKRNAMLPEKVADLLCNTLGHDISEIVSE